jgi:hypothetical protein
MFYDQVESVVNVSAVLCHNYHILCLLCFVHVNGVTLWWFTDDDAVWEFDTGFSCDMYHVHILQLWWYASVSWCGVHSPFITHLASLTRIEVLLCAEMNRPFTLTLDQIFTLTLDQIFTLTLDQIFTLTLDQIFTLTLDQIFTLTLDQIFTLTLDQIFTLTLDQIFTLTLDQIFTLRLDQIFTLTLDRPFITFFLQYIFRLHK